MDAKIDKTSTNRQLTDLEKQDQSQGKLNCSGLTLSGPCSNQKLHLCNYHVDIIDMISLPAQAPRQLAQFLRAFQVVLLHLRQLISIWLEETVVENSCCSVHHSLITMEPTTLAHGAYSIWESMVYVVEKHLVPSMPSSQKECHDHM